MYVDSVVKNLSGIQEMRVQSLEWEDPLEKEMATHSNILAWEIPWTEEPSGLQPMGSQRDRHNLATKQQQHMCVCVVVGCCWVSQSCLTFVTLWTHARLPCPSLPLGICSNSCSLSWWCHSTISCSITPSPLALNLSQR